MWELDKDRREKPRSGVVVMVSQIKIEEKKKLCITCLSATLAVLCKKVIWCQV